ncbi:ADAM 17-like protease isoform X2 [Physella acuta]|nr:ADAM 17-like protease isoform X2 [Physella acuta]XP_059139264.1 ADAM 17-like protease isoform X2 [Physella acuta]
MYKELKFSILQRDFQLVLKSGTDILAAGFVGQLVHEDGKTSPFHVNQDLIFKGHLKDKPDVSVNAHMEDDLWSIKIFEKEEIYAVEPARNVLTPAENPKNHSLVAYKSTDLPFDGWRCGAVDAKHKARRSENFTTRSSSRRQKRSGADTCVVYVIGDYGLFSDRCKKNYQTCYSAMISMVDFTDQLFRESPFEGRNKEIYTNVGIQIGKIVLYTTPTISKEEFRYKHFNAPDVEWGINERLDAFAYHLTYQPDIFCHNHLFSHYALPERVLGLAFLDGICRTSPRGTVVHSAGVTSGMDIGSGMVTSLMMTLVFAHGHNFGSNHDPETAECSKPDEQGGNFLMWPSSVSGTKPNHWLFSPCSLKQIGRGINHASCFHHRSLHTAFCGNGVVDPEEECDAGTNSKIGADKCCTPDCKLKPTATCSDFNTVCCSNCTIAITGTVCAAALPNECKNEAYCVGTEHVCADPEFLPDNSTCVDGGHCYGGKCRSFCEMTSIEKQKQLESCVCRGNENGCKWCCFDSSDPKNPGMCEPYSEDFREDGSPCNAGFCEQGICIPSQSSTINRVYDFLYSQSPVKIKQFAKSNVVMTTILVALLIWCPVGCCIRRSDKKEQRRRSWVDDVYVHQIGQPPPNKTITYHGPILVKPKFKTSSISDEPSTKTGAPKHIEFQIDDTSVY